MKTIKWTKRSKITVAIIISFSTLFILQNCTKPDALNNAVNTSDSNALTSATIAEGTYKINVSGLSDKVLSLTTSSVDDNVPVAVKIYKQDSSNQLWHLTPYNGLYRISNAYSGKVLVAPSGAAGVRLIQNRFDTSAAQFWQIKYMQNGNYQFINKASSYCITVDAAGDSRGVVRQTSFSNKQNQLWQLTAVQAIYVDVDATNFFRRTEGWIASDGASSIAMNDGRVAWFMGDSHIDDYFYNTGKTYCLFQVRNAALMQPASHTFDWKQSQTLTGNPFPGIQSYLKNKASDDYWMWPGCGVQPNGNDTMYVYNQPLKKTGNTSWSWADDSLPVWAKIRTSDMKVLGYSYIQDFNGINFGMGFVKEDDGYIYAYGYKPTFIYCNVYVARFPANNPNAKWSFWTGTAWSKNVKDIKRVSEGASNGVCVVKYNNNYIAISTEFSVGCDQGTAIYAAVSKSPTGPFTNRQPFYSIPDRLEGHAPFFYAPNAHPQFKNSNNELLVTYDINGYSDCVNTCIGGRTYPDYYRPRAIRVPLSLIKAE